MFLVITMLFLFGNGFFVSGSDWYVFLPIKTVFPSVISLNNSKSSSSSSNASQDKTDYEENLKKLKSLFDQNLISQDEYDAKRKEILDAM